MMGRSSSLVTVSEDIKTQTRYEESSMMTIKKIGTREKRITNDIVHKISRQIRRIVNRALERDALIVLGDIKHLRKRKQNKLHTKLTEGRVSVLQTDPVSTRQRGDFSLGAFHVTMLSERYKERRIMFCCNRCCDENADMRCCL